MAYKPLLLRTHVEHLTPREWRRWLALANVEFVCYANHPEETRPQWVEALWLKASAECARRGEQLVLWRD